MIRSALQSEPAEELREGEMLSQSCKLRLIEQLGKGLADARCVSWDRVNSEL